MQGTCSLSRTQPVTRTYRGILRSSWAWDGTPESEAADLHRLALDAPRAELAHGISRKAALDGDIGGLVGHVDLADLLARQSGFGGQCAHHVAGADLVFLAAEDLQRAHRRQQRRLIGDDQ